MYHSATGGQKTVCKSQFFLSTVWVLGIEVSCQIWQPVASSPEQSHQSLSTSSLSNIYYVMYSIFIKL